MSEFDAGSIIATMDLNRDPMIQGLERSKQDIRELQDAKHDVEIAVEADTARARGEIDALEHSVQGAQGAPGGGPGGGGMMGLIAAAAALAPALLPIAGSAAAVGSGFMAMIAEVGIAGGIFAKVAGSDFSDMQDALKKVNDNAKEIPGPMGQAASAFNSMKGAVDSLKASTAGPVFGTLTAAFREAALLLPTIAPLVDATAKALTSAVGTLGNFLGGSQVQDFLKLLSANIGPEIQTLATVIVNFGSGVISLLTAAQPLINVVEGMAKSVSAEFANWAKSEGPVIVQKMLDMLNQYGPQIMSTLGSLFSTIGSIGNALMPLAGPALSAIQVIAQGLASIGKVDLGPIAGAVGALLNAVTPLIPIFVQLVNAILPPLAQVLKDVSQQGIAPLVQSLGQQLQPIIQAIGPFFQALVPILDSVIIGFRNLISPAAMGLVVPLFVDLLNAITPLLPIIGQLVTEAENISTVFFESLTPLLPSLGELISTVGHAFLQLLQAVQPLIAPMMQLISGALQWLVPLLIPIVNGFSSLVSALGPVGPAILIAVVGFQKFQELAGAFNSFFLGIPRLLDGVTGAWNALSTGAGLARDAFMWIKDGALVEMLVSWASKIGDVIAAIRDWTVVQWLLDLAMDANPIGLIILGIGLLVAAVIYCYTHFDTFRQIVSDVWDWIQRLGQAIGGWFANLWHDIVSWAQNIWSDVTGWFSRTWHDVVTNVSNMYNAVIGFFSNLWTNVSGFVGNLVSNIIGWFQRLPGAVWDAISNVGTDIWNVFSGIANWMFNIGQDIMNGLWNGITWVWNRIWNWLVGAANDIGNVFRNVLSIFSPSRVMHDIGMNTMLGLHGGLQDTYDSVVSPGLNSIANKIKGFAPTIGLGANAQIQSTVSVQVAGQAQAQADMQAKLDSLIHAVNQVAGATGKAVGSTVGDAFTQATAQSTRTLITAGRTS